MTDKYVVQVKPIFRLLYSFAFANQWQTLQARKQVTTTFLTQCGRHFPNLFPNMLTFPDSPQHWKPWTSTPW